MPFGLSLNEEKWEGTKVSEELLYKELSYEIVNAAIFVWKELGFGFLEKVGAPLVSSSQNSGVRMKSTATRFEDLVMWQNAHQFVLKAVGGLFTSHSGF
jgi:hypothetical protein